MKGFTSKLLLLIAGVFSGLFFNSETKACNLTDFTLLSVTGTGPYTISVRLCVGAGRTGAVRGADDETRTVTFAFYAGIPVTFSSFSPANLVGAFTGCSMPGVDVGPIGPPFGSGNIMYIDPGYYGMEPCLSTPFTCISTTALCGNIAQECNTFTFVTNVCPDSIRVFGVEASGSPFGGCTYNSDMMVRPCLALAPAVFQGVEYDLLDNGKVKFSWQSPSPEADHFRLLKTKKIGDVTTWYEVGEVHSVGIEDYVYSLTDNSPGDGTWYYQMMLIKNDETSIRSEIMKVVVNSQDDFFIFPNPANDKITVSGKDLTEVNLVNAAGQVVGHYEFQPLDQKEINLTGIIPGIYIVQARQSNGSVLQRKAIVQ